MMTLHLLLKLVDWAVMVMAVALLWFFSFTIFPAMIILAVPVIWIGWTIHEGYVGHWGHVALSIMVFFVLCVQAEFISAWKEHKNKRNNTASNPPIPGDEIVLTYAGKQWIIQNEKEGAEAVREALMDRRLGRSRASRRRVD